MQKSEAVSADVTATLVNANTPLQNASRREIKTPGGIYASVQIDWKRILWCDFFSLIYSLWLANW